ncbi:hypothetical protein MMC21_000665 [Puttea exsequens]|nr:hypothetical protein [Puttea exsequens]
MASRQYRLLRSDSRFPASVQPSNAAEAGAERVQSASFPGPLNRRSEGHRYDIERLEREAQAFGGVYDVGIGAGYHGIPGHKAVEHMEKRTSYAHLPGSTVRHERRRAAMDRLEAEAQAVGGVYDVGIGAMSNRKGEISAPQADRTEQRLGRAGVLAKPAKLSSLDLALLNVNKKVKESSEDFTQGSANTTDYNAFWAGIRAAQLARLEHHLKETLTRGDTDLVHGVFLKCKIRRWTYVNTRSILEPFNARMTDIDAGCVVFEYQYMQYKSKISARNLSSEDLDHVEHFFHLHLDGYQVSPKAKPYTTAMLKSSPTALVSPPNLVVANASRSADVKTTATQVEHKVYAGPVPATCNSLRGKIIPSTTRAVSYGREAHNKAETDGLKTFRATHNNQTFDSAIERATTEIEERKSGITGGEAKSGSVDLKDSIQNGRESREARPDATNANESNLAKVASDDNIKFVVDDQLQMLRTEELEEIDLDADWEEDDASFSNEEGWELI